MQRPLEVQPQGVPGAEKSSGRAQEPHRYTIGRQVPWHGRKQNVIGLYGWQSMVFVMGEVTSPKRREGKHAYTWGS
jgi:hypothetical protein